MEDYEVIVSLFGKKYKCTVEAKSENDAAIRAENLLASKISTVTVNKKEKETIKEVLNSDVASMFEQIFGKF